MRRQQHFHGLNHLHYLTTSTYRRARRWSEKKRVSADLFVRSAVVRRQLQTNRRREKHVCATGFRVWQRKFYDMNIWSEKKRLEKLNYMHQNPVKRRLVEKQGDWPWSSWRFYYLEGASILAMERMP